MKRRLTAHGEKGRRGEGIELRGIKINKIHIAKSKETTPKNMSCVLILVLFALLSYFYFYAPAGLRPT